MVDKIAADYQALNKIASQFAQQASEVQKMHQRVNSHVNNLKNGGWIGRGSDAFYREMQDLVLPGVQRLRQVLEEASRATKQVSSDMSQAEEEASSPFHTHQ